MDEPKTPVEDFPDALVHSSDTTDKQKVYWLRVSCRNYLQRLGFLEAEVAQAHRLLDLWEIAPGSLPHRIAALHVQSFAKGVRVTLAALDTPAKTPDKS